MAIVISPPAEVALLQVGWPVYIALLAENADRSNPTSYDGDVLESVSPSKQHEMYARLLDRLVFDVGRIWGVELVGAGSTTPQREPQCRGGALERRPDVELGFDFADDGVGELRRGRVAAEVARRGALADAFEHGFIHRP